MRSCPRFFHGGASPLIDAENENAMTWFRPEASSSTEQHHHARHALVVLKLTYLSKNYEHNVS
jgi:hypothetical protein